MLTILNENYFIDLDKIEEYLDISEPQSVEDENSGTSEIRVNVVKFELVKMLLETVLMEQEMPDEKLGLRGASTTSIPFKLAFNSLLNKKLINKY